MSIILELKSVNAGYDAKTILHNVNISINELDYIGVIGPNGGGKTTFVRVILGLIKPFSGQIISYNGFSKEKIGYLPQVSKIDYSFPISVKEVIMSGLTSKRVFFNKFTKSEKELSSQLIDNMGISELADRSIGTLSGGQMQRVLLARAIISNPKLLILDEPVTFVDNNFEHDLYNILKKLNETTSIIMVSHDLGTITSHVKTIACINRELHYHKSNQITESELCSYNCPIQIISHGAIPHTILNSH